MQPFSSHFDWATLGSREGNNLFVASEEKGRERGWRMVERTTEQEEVHDVSGEDIPHVVMSDE